MPFTIGTAAEWSSIIGLLATFVGFAITIYNVIKTKSAARAASEATSSFRNEIARLQASGSLSSTITSLDEIKRLHRDKKWNYLPEKYSNLRRSLIIIKESTTGLSENQVEIIQTAISQFSQMERLIDKSIMNDTEPSSPDRLVSILSEQSDNLQIVVAQIQALVSPN